MLFVVPWWISSFASNFAICGIERINRACTGGWGDALWHSWPLIVFAQWMLFRSFNGAPSWMLAWAVFTGGNALVRVLGVAVWEPAGVGSWAWTLAGLVVVLGGGLCVKMGMR